MVCFSITKNLAAPKERKGHNIKKGNWTERFLRVYANKDSKTTIKDGRKLTQINRKSKEDNLTAPIGRGLHWKTKIEYSHFYGHIRNW